MIGWELVIFVTLICMFCAVVWELVEAAVEAINKDKDDD